MAGRNNIDIQLNATNRATPVIQQVQGSLRGLDGAAGTAAKGLAGLAGAFGAGALIGLAGQIGGAVTELAQLAGASEAVGASFRDMAAAAGQNSSQILAQMQTVSRGTISEYDLMLSANRAMMLGVADSAEEMNALMTVAMSRGRAMGLSTQQAFSDLVTGLGRASPLILDNLGIVVDAESLYAEYAAQLGVTAASLDETQKKQALVNRVMAEAGTVDLSNVEGMASSFERAQASIADMKASLGELFGPAIATVADAIARAAEGANQLGQNIAVALNPPTPTLTEALDEAAARLDAATANYRTMLGEEPPAGLVGQLNRLLELGATLDMVTSELQPYYAQLLAVAQAERDWVAARAGLDAAQWNIGEDVRNAALLAQQEQERAAQAAVVANQQAAQETLAAWQSSYGQIAQTAMGFAGLSGAQVNSLINSAVAQFDILTASGYSAEAALSMVNAVLSESAARMQELNTAELAAAAGATTAANALSAFGLSASAATPAVGTLGAAANASALQFLGLADAAVDAAAKVSAAFEMANAGLAGLANKARLVDGLDAANRDTVGVTLPRLNRQLDDAGGKTDAIINRTLYMPPAIERAATATGGLSAAAREAQTEFNSLAGKVESVLSGALNLDVGVNPEDFLPRPDAINENARRLADIMVGGFKGQDWLGEFAAEVPDIYALLRQSGDPRGEAARLLQEFQAGLRPELLDKGAAKERVRQMMLGEQNVSAMAQEIAAELSAEMGTSLATTTAAAMSALGVTIPGMALGGDAAGGKAAGGGIVLDGAGEGNRFLTGVQTAIAARMAEMRAVGESVGSAWGEGFLSQVRANVPTALIDLLANLTGQRLAEQESRAGAVP